MPYQRNITSADKIFYDTDQILRYTIYAPGATDAQIAAGTAIPQDVTGWSMSWTLRRKTGSPDPPLILKTTSGGGITITGVFNSDPLLNTQRVDVLIEDKDTYDTSVNPIVNIEPGMYQYALKRTDTANETILAWGSFELLQAAGWETP